MSLTVYYRWGTGLTTRCSGNPRIHLLMLRGFREESSNTDHYLPGFYEPYFMPGKDAVPGGCQDSMKFIRVSYLYIRYLEIALAKKHWPAG